MNYQSYPKYLKGNLSVFGIDLIDLCISMLFGVVVKRSLLGSAPQYTIFVIALTFVVIQFLKSSVPKGYIYFLLNRKSSVVVSYE